MLAEPPREETGRLAELLELGTAPSTDEYTELFLFQLYPYASVYTGAQGMLGGEARDRVAGFWRALGETPPAEPDHLAVMLAQYAGLVERENSERNADRRRALHRARATFLWEHLVSWLPVYLFKMRDVGVPTYRVWSRLLADVLATEAQRTPEPSDLPLHLRAAPSLTEPAETDRSTFVGGVLAPIQSGMILTRADLARAARATGLGLRAGERRFTLEALLDQDPAATWTWLEGEATAWIARHRQWDDVSARVAGFWRRRASRAGAAFRTLARRSVASGSPATS